MTRGSGKTRWVLLFVLALCVGIGLGLLADAPSPPTRPDGLEAAVDDGVGAGFIHPGDRAVTQQVTLTDSDADAEDVSLIGVVLDNLETATAADFALIEILDGFGAVIGQVANPDSFPLTIDIDPDHVIVDGGAGVVTETLQVRCTIKAGVVGRSMIQTKLTIRHAEGAVGWVIPFERVVNDGNVTTINNCPTADADVATTTEDAPVAGIAVLPNDDDLDVDPLNVTNLNTAGIVGNVTQVGNTFTYDPNGQFESLGVTGGVATDTDTFDYTMSDGDDTCGAGQRTATVTVTITGVNDAPVAVNDAGTTDEDTAIVVDVLGNDTDVDNGDVLTISGIHTTGTVGCVTNNGNNIAYDPCGNFEGLKTDQADTFQYTVSDGNGGTDIATVTITVTGINDPPVVTDDAAGTPEDTPVVINVLGNDTDADDALTVGSVTQGANGNVANNGGDVTYTPNPDWCGVDTFTYTANDGTNSPVQGTVTVTVACVNDAPVAVDDADTTNEDTSIVVDVLINDTDADTPAALGGDVLTVSGIHTTGTAGLVTNNGTNVTYDPNGQFEGLKTNAVDTFQYTVSDGKGGTDIATVTITVTGVNDPPVVVDDAAGTPEDTAVVIDVLGNDSDLDDALIVNAVTQGANGAVTNNSGDVTYTPNPDWCGVDTFTYTVNDGVNAAAQATVTVTVACVNDDPVGNGDAAVVDEDSANNVIDVLANDTDADPADVLFVDAIVTVPGNGTVVNNSTDVSYTPNPNFVGNDWFEYRVADGNGGTGIARVDVTVRAASPRLEDDMESGVNGWESTGQWRLSDEGLCCPPPMPSDTHAWVFGNNGFFVGNGTLTSQDIDVTGLDEVDIVFWYCMSINRAYALAFIGEVSFDGGAWAPVWPNGGAPVQDAWTQVAPIRVGVKAGATTMKLRFNLTSRFGWGCIGVDDVVVSPADGGGSGNRPPTAVAGADQEVCVADLVNLDGSASNDPDLDPLAYDWTFLARPVGSAAVLNNATTPTPSFIADVSGEYQVQLEVDDGNGGTDTDVVIITARICGGDALFFDEMEAGQNGWQATGMWELVGNPPADVPSPTHAWAYGGTVYTGNGTLTSPAISVAGQDTVLVVFDSYLSINPYAWFSTAGTRASVEVSFGDGWQELARWDDASPEQDAWINLGPFNVLVPAGATIMRVRFNFISRLGKGGWWLDDVRVLGVAPLGSKALDPMLEASRDNGFFVESVSNLPNPIRDIHTTRFTVKGVGIEQIEIQLFDQAGRMVFDSGWQPNGYDWHLETNNGETLANGVYLYVVTVMGPNGELVITETKKLAVYR